MKVDGLKSDDEKNSKRISVTISEKKPCNRVGFAGFRTRDLSRVRRA